MPEIKNTENRTQDTACPEQSRREEKARKINIKNNMPFMKLYFVCQACGGELESEWKAAYTEENSLGIQIKPCPQCCDKGDNDV